MRLILVMLVAAGLANRPVLAAHTQASLLVDSEVAIPGQVMLAGVHLQMDPEWHVYWRNSGASGQPLKVTWNLPAGVTAGELLWPVPEKLSDTNVTSYIYEKEVVLLTPLTVASNVAAGPLELKARVDWVECAVLCVPGKADVSATVTVGSERKPSKDAPLLTAWQKRLPHPAAEVAPVARWEAPESADMRPLVLEWKPAGSLKSADFYPDNFENFEVAGKTEWLGQKLALASLRLHVKKFSGDWPGRITGLRVEQRETEQTAFETAVNINPPSGGQEVFASSGAGPLSLLGNLLYGFLGGLILNIMPCVLPVIALKILSFVNEARNHPARVRKLGLIYCLGVLTSFLVLAALVIGLKVAGQKAGWGMQFSNPQFLVVLTVLVTLVALNLFGVFEVNLGGEVIGAAGNLASRQGAAGAFFNGVLATVLATPCTAPFLSIALGFAFAQKAAVIVLVFLSVGLGLAFPYVLLSWHPAWLKFLPKPGAWMEKFKIAMGFPMLATAFWLLSLIPNHYGMRSWWLGIFLVMIALAAWVYGEFAQRGRSRRGLARALVLVIVVAGYLSVLEGKLRWRNRSETGGLANRKHGLMDTNIIPWQAWSLEGIGTARAAGRPVLVDFTATWCLTCNAIVKPALEDPAVRQMLQQINGVPFLADYSDTPDNITEELARYQRAGVPLVLVYSKNASVPPMVLPDPSPLRSPSHYRGIVLEALKRAAQ